MKLLIAVKSCVHDANRGDHNVIRNTWGKDISGADLRFFVGQGTNYVRPLNDEVMIDAPDDYDSLTLKTIEICRWSVQQEYDYTFLCDTDTFLVPNRLLKCGFEKFDFGGLATKPLGQVFSYAARDRNGIDHDIPECYSWASGGYGYFLSRKAMEIILAAPRPTTSVMVWCEDLWVGQQLGPLYNEGKIKAINIPNFQNHISWHFPQSVYNSQYHPRFGWMEKMHREQR